MERNRFYVYAEWWEALKDYPLDIKGELFDAIFRYAVEGEETELSKEAAMAFNFLKIKLKRDKKEYANTCEKNKENGKRGGRPKKEQNNPKNPVGFSKTKNNPPKAKKADKNRIDIINTLSSDKDINRIELINTHSHANDVSVSALVSDTLSDTSQEKTAPTPQSPPPQVSERYEKFCLWMDDNAPYIVKHYTSLISEKEFDKLMDTYSPNDLADVISNIENRIDLRKKYTNLYRTVLNWLKRDKA